MQARTITYLADKTNEYIHDGLIKFYKPIACNFCTNGNITWDERAKQQHDPHLPKVLPYSVASIADSSHSVGSVADSPHNVAHSSHSVGGVGHFG